jgi:hypothetical protein
VDLEAAASAEERLALIRKYNVDYVLLNMQAAYNWGAMLKSIEPFGSKFTAMTGISF